MKPLRASQLTIFLVLCLGAASAQAGKARLDAKEMAALPDDRARAAAQALADAVENEDATAMAALVPDKGLRVLKKKRSRKQVAQLLEDKGVVGLVGRLPRGLVMDKRDRADGLTHNWHVERDGKKRVLLYAIEYGVVREALLGKVGDSWKLVELRDADHGEP